MLLYPQSTPHQLEFDKIKSLLENYCQTEYAKQKVANLRIHTHKKYIETELNQTHEFKLIQQQSQYFPLDFTTNIFRSIKLLGIDGATLSGEQFLQIKSLSENINNIYRWFDNERRSAYPFSAQVIADSHYDKNIIVWIDEIIDEAGNVKDNASEDLQKIRMSLFRKRNELRRMFDKVLAKLAKAGYSADIDESFSSGRRVVAVFSEHKRQVKGILHGESDSRKTAFIEPEETIQLNNDVFSLEYEESKEIQKILRSLTKRLNVFAPLLQSYLEIIGEFDFIKSKAKLAIDVNGNLPNIVDKAFVDLKDAYHPLLYSV